MESLPKTFQDAVLFTHKLGIRFLWIGSLCILQDNKSDWHQEASNMTGIYQHSYLNLAATKSSCPADGCFPQTFDRELIIDNDRKYRGVYVRNKNRHCIGESKVTGFPLLTRGWAYQERLLSARVLHVGPDELFWECNEALDCECGFLGESHGQWPKIFHQPAVHSSDHFTRTERWHRIVTDHSSLELSYESDRLHALTGLAAQIQSVQGSEHLCGLWSDSLAEDLLWERSMRPAQGETRQAPLPSWSWASVHGPVEFAHLTLRTVTFRHNAVSSRSTSCGQNMALNLLGYVAPANLHPQNWIGRANLAS